MALIDDPNFAQALDGVVNATRWCDNNGYDELAKELGEVYQEMGNRIEEDAPINTDNKG